MFRLLLAMLAPFKAINAHRSLLARTT